MENNLMHLLSNGDILRSLHVLNTIDVGKLKELDMIRPLHVCALQGNIPDIANVLVNKGADINGKSTIGFAMAHYIAQDGKSELFKLLHTLGADLNVQNRVGGTPLHVAAFFGHTDCVSVLLELGANQDIKNKYGETALVVAQQEEHSDCATLLQHITKRT